MPLYARQCPDGHTADVLRSIARMDEPVDCDACGKPTARIMARSHVAPDGVYSYAPNIGDPDRFERQRQAIKDGVKVIPREHSRGYDAERGS